MPTYNHTGTDNQLSGEPSMMLRDSRYLKQDIPGDRPLTSEELSKLTSWFIARRLNLLKLKNFYELHHDIENRKFYCTDLNEDGEYEKVEDFDRPNNKLVNDFPGYIVTVASSYFMGKPLSYTAKSECKDEVMEKLQSTFDYNDESTHNYKLAVDQSLYGTAYELLWTDKSFDNPDKPNGETRARISGVSPLECFVCYDPESLEGEPTAGFRIITKNDLLTDTVSYIVEEYLKDRVYTYKGLTLDSLMCENIEGIPHNYKQVPIIEYPNNDNRWGDFERVISLIDNYDLVTSDGVNDSQDFADSFLLIKNMMGTTKGDIRRVKQTKVVLTDEDGDAKFITKGTNTSADGSVPMESTLTKNIHKFSYIPPLDDTNFSGNASGAAMEFKMWGLEQLTSVKERIFKKAVTRRIEMIFSLFQSIKGTSDYDFTLIETKFQRNLPKDAASIADQMVKLNGILSDETLVSLYPKIEDSKSECIKAKQDREEKARLEAQAMYGDTFNTGMDSKSVTDSTKYSKPSQYKQKEGTTVKTDLGKNDKKGKKVKRVNE